MGHNPVVAIREFDGDVEFDPADPQNARLRLRIRANSLEVRNEMNDRDRQQMERAMKDEVLETSQFPEIVFDGTGAATPKNGSSSFQAQIQGDLMLHGVTRKQVVSAQLLLMGGMLRANGSFTLRQTDYRIKLASVAGGVLKLKDELQFTYDIVTRRKES
jgi:polyisoprenoid-binding protein YceI